ncbi:MAG: 50S ribosomal protein L18 [Deltaproteobacteria bacterium RBG_19FT_COMBO_46_9]|nr:MAG: 50S ribosomal protein L18 [Deltaproteobacteria bacterium RBG_19FT_COMBO_46_9]
MGVLSKAEARLKRKKRIRKKLIGTTERPRLTIFRSAKNIYVQIVDDTTSRTLAEASSLSRDIRSQITGKGGNKEGALIIGKLIAERALEKGIKRIIFDRNGFLYHGRVKALADAVREHGLEF